MEAVFDLNRTLDRGKHLIVTGDCFTAFVAYQVVVRTVIREMVDIPVIGFPPVDAAFSLKETQGTADRRDRNLRVFLVNLRDYFITGKMPAPGVDKIQYQPAGQ
jgi:hypothetical protein